MSFMLQIFLHKNHHNIYILSLIFIAIGLPVSEFLVSVGEIMILINWILEKDFKNKTTKFFSNKPAVFLASFYLLYLLGFIWTNQDFYYALKNVKIKLPLLLLPIVISSSKTITKKEFTLILKLFISTVFVGSIICFFVYLKKSKNITFNYRGISIYISHIRFSLLIVFSIFILIYNLFFNKLKTTFKLLLLLLISWFIYFIFILNSMSGIFIFIIMLPILIIYYVFKLNKKYLFGFSLLFVFIVFVIISTFLCYKINKFYSIKKMEIKMSTKTKYGEKYQHDFESLYMENGYYVDRHIAKNELKKAWEKRSKIPIYEKNKNEILVFTNIKRFLTSKGLKKDREGIEKLTKKEILAIERGISNVDILNNSTIINRVNKIIWAIYNYKQGGNPSGSSTMQRLEFWKTGWHIFKNNPIIGIGTGDVQQEFYIAYNETNSSLTKKYQFITHNQYFTVAITFGILGFIWFLFVLFSPILKNEPLHPLFFAFYGIILLSMLNEDTLETQTGVTFFAYFFCLFITLKKNNKNISLKLDRFF